MVNYRDQLAPDGLRRAETVGDVLRRVNAGSKVVALSIKDRGAIFPAGEAGTAYMYMSQTGQYASTTYYMKEHPRWVQEYNARKPADAYFHQEWKPLLPDSAYARSLPDEQKWYPKGGKLPKKMGEGMDRPAPAASDGKVLPVMAGALKEGRGEGVTGFPPARG